MSERSSIDITFERTSHNAAMYRLWSDPGHKYPRDGIANVSELPPYSSWSLGKDDWKDDHVDGRSDGGRLYHAQLSFYPRPHEPALPPLHAAVKWMRGRRAIDALRHEAGMYTGPLRGLQGKIVPLFYGFFSGVVDGVEIGVLILEWCPRNDWVTFGRPSEGELLKRMEAVRLLHLAGVKHGQLYERRDSLRLYDGRHFLRAPDGTMRIVGFQHAKMHRCAGGLRECDGVKSPLEGRCRELCYAEVHGRRAIGPVSMGEAPWRPY